MTALIPPPVDLRSLQPAEPLPRRRRFIPRSRRGKTAIAGGLVVLLVAGLLGATYTASPGGALWGVQKTIFPEHAQDVALTAVVNDLKKAQDILGSGQQPTPDQLTDARTALNQAKQDLDYLSPSPERTSLQNLYLQLTQQLLQYTPDTVLQLAPLPAAPPAPPAADPTAPQQDAVALTSATAPTWGYGAPDDYVPAPPGVPDSPMADWPQPVDPPVTPNLNNLGYYDPSWDQLYGYNPGGWYNYDLSGYNQYGYDFIGFDRWGYDRWGYDRWGYDRWGYNWAGYNWAGYDRHGWDRNGCNEWGQRRDRPGDPRRQDWYDRHHPYHQYYQWKFHVHDPVYRRTQWDRAHGFNPDRYQDWNRNRDWRNPRNRDWAPPAAPVRTTVDIHVSSPVVNLNASLTQFISNDKATRASGPLMKALADKSARSFAKDLTPRPHPLTGPPLESALRKQSDTGTTNHEASAPPPALTAPEPATAPSKVSPGFRAPKLDPVPAYTPPVVDKPRDKPETAPAPEAGLDPSPRLPATPPRADRPNPGAASPDQPGPASSPDPALDRPHETPAPRQTAPDPQAPAQEAPAAPEAPRQQESPRQRNAPEEPPVQRDPAPKAQVPEPAAPAPKTQAPEPAAPVWQEPTPEREAPAPKEAPAPRYQAPERQAPVWQEPAQQAPPQEAPARQRPPREAPARQEPPAREAPAQRQAPAPRSEPASPKGPKCPPPMCSGRGN